MAQDVGTILITVPKTKGQKVFGFSVALVLHVLY